MRLGCLFALGILVGIATGCAAPAPTPDEQMAIWREAAVSERTWTRAKPHLEALAPGDELGIFQASRRIYLQGRGKAARPIVVIPSWITSLSGGSAGGLSMLGRLIGRQGDRIRGYHVFGIVTRGRIQPRFQVFTEAVLVERAEFEALLANRAPGIGQLPRPEGGLFFRDLMVVATRPLTWPDAPAELPEDVLSRFHSEAAFRAIEPVLDALPDGTDLMSLLEGLGAIFVTDDFGENHSLLVPGFLQTREVRTQTAVGPAGIFKLRPFGWQGDGGVVIDRIAIFLNDRLLQVVPHRGLDDWLGYLDPSLL